MPYTFLKFVFAILFSLIASAAIGQQRKAPYNQKMADSLGADANGMKMYVLVILKTGPAKIERKTLVDSLFAGHMQNIGRLAEARQLVVAGPFKKNDKNYRGIFILNVNTVADARKLLLTDPAVAAGLLESEIYEWYGSAALPLYLEGHSQIEK